MGDSTYDSGTGKISIQLQTVYDTAIDMWDDLNAIELNWYQLMFHWNNLKLAWVGKTQQEVDDFQTRITKVQNEIFGTNKKDPGDSTKEILDKPGLYQQVKGIALGATQNYHNTDGAVSNMFSQVSANITDTTFVTGAAPKGTPDTPADEAAKGGVVVQGGMVYVKPQPDATGNAPDVKDPPISETFGS